MERVADQPLAEWMENRPATKLLWQRKEGCADDVLSGSKAEREQEATVVPSHTVES